MATEQISRTLNNGVTMPALGFGVFQTSPADTIASVKAALADGYRLIDTAAIYGNERQVGEAIRESDVPRDELFVTTKLWFSDFGPTKTPAAFEASLRRLGLDYVDLYLLHWPAPSTFDDSIAAYQAAEQLLTDGKVRAIGVSNFSADHLKRLLEQATTVPAVNQVEFHPYFNNVTLQAADNGLGILTQAWSPIGGVTRYSAADPEHPHDPLHDPVITGLAEKYGKSPSQVILRWHLDQGRAAVPKSKTPSRIAENLDVFDFQLNNDELAAIDALNTGIRTGGDPEILDNVTYPKKPEDN